MLLCKIVRYDCVLYMALRLYCRQGNQVVTYTLLFLYIYIHLLYLPNINTKNSH
jgi:hypothetical protein